MERRKEPRVMLDTHIVIWMYLGHSRKLSQKARVHIDGKELIISPMVKLEMQYLYEIGRLKDSPDEICDVMFQSVGLKISPTSFQDCVKSAIQIHWTRDTFDRLIVASAHAEKLPLVTADKNIRKHFKNAIW